MSLATVRLPEVMGRNTEKHPAGVKHPQGAGQAGPIASVQQSEGATLGSRDASPVRKAQQRQSVFDQEYTIRPSSVVDGREPAPGRRSEGELPINARPLVNLDSCPSFAEQRATGSKPLFFERHGTLKHVHELQLSKQDEPVDTNGVTSPASAERQPDASNSLQFLPSWDVARSQLWLLTEAALLQAPADQAARCSPHTARPDHSLSTVSAPASGSGRASHLAPVAEESCAPARANLTQASPFALRQLQASITQQMPSLRSLSADAWGQAQEARRCPATPLGLGPLPLLMPLGSMRSGRSQIARALTEFNSNASGKRQGPDAHDEPQVPQPQPKAPTSRGPAAGVRHHHVAYAAGVAAATSTIAAVSEATSVATAGLSGAHLSFTSAAIMHLGAQVVNVGSTAAVNKFQSVAMNKSTMAAADAVLGPEADPSLRENLRSRLRTTLAGVSVMWFLLNLHTTTDLVAHLDFEHDFVTSARVVLNLATTGPNLMNNCRELLQVGVAVAMGVAQRNAILVPCPSPGK